MTTMTMTLTVTMTMLDYDILPQRLFVVNGFTFDLSNHHVHISLLLMFFFCLVFDFVKKVFAFNRR
jgi:hypothetical protein